MRFYIIAALAVLLMGGCSKAEYGADTAYGSISFFNASYTLNTFFPVSGGFDRKVELPLTPDGKLPVPLMGRGIPDFTPSANYRRDFPGINSLNEIPWTEFDHYTPGTYTANMRLITADTAMVNQFAFPVTVEQDQQHTYLLSDSLGTFHVTTMKHAAGSAGKVRLRLVQLCPDADSVNMRIGSNLLTSMQNLPYRSVSDYIDYPLTTDSTLKLRLFNAGDTLNVIARADLAAQPGQSYMVICWKYRQAHQYTDKEGNTVNIVPGALLEVRRLE